MERTQDFNPMVYDAMREIANRIVGRYIAWKREAATEAQAAHWQAEAGRLAREVREVNPYDQAAVDAKRAELRERFAALPERAPELVV